MSVTLKREAIFTAKAPKPMMAYSQAIRAGDYVFVKGQVSTDITTNELILEPLETQYEQTFNNVLAITVGAGGSVDDIVKLDIFVKDLDSFPIINKAVPEAIPGPHIAVTEAAGGTAHDIVKLGIFVTDIQQIQALNEVTKKIFREPYPARNVVPVNKIPRGGNIEIDAIVYLPQNK
ncbi:unnamed protein product [Oppiella nova]|uniref:Uncharacterized protein n=1 Tax=Oppiella nova TaxID=334625 RepID=A0A7R9M132_9ACAR|nr:unnamed protein product [Oppiella nova]CAG2168666.1 unnamed protein product [Oppiella nova]